MEYQSPYSIDVPICDIPTFIFSSGSPESRRSPQFFDAENPTLNYSLYDAEILVKRVALGLQNLGLQAGDKVLLFSGNQLHFPVLLWGIIAARCVFTGCTPTASVQELLYQVKDSGARIILTDPQTTQKALQAAEAAGLSKESVYNFCDVHQGVHYQSRTVPYVQPWTNFWAPIDHAKLWRWKTITLKEEAQETTAIINYSSGTTGLPKGVEISHYNLIANAEQVLHKRNLVANTPAGVARKERLGRSGERWLVSLPMYHAFGQTYFCINAPRSGAKVYIMKQFTLPRFLLFMDIYRITYMTSVPTMMVMLSKDDSAPAYNFKAVEQVVSGSAPLGKGIGALVQKRYLQAGVDVKQGWGMTECTCSATAFAAEDKDDGGSVGWLYANTSAKIVPVDDREFEDASGGKKEVGEIWLAGPNIMKGYFNRPKETADTIVTENGKRWLKTGDIGYFDERGCLYIVDRLKELIKVKGLQVAPAEIEAVLLLHPGIQDAAVGPVKRDGYEYPKAYIVRRSKDLRAREVEIWVQDRLSKHKWLAGGISFIDLIPRTASGKVQRRRLPDAKIEARESKI